MCFHTMRSSAKRSGDTSEVRRPRRPPFSAHSLAPDAQQLRKGRVMCGPVIGRGLSAEAVDRFVFQWLSGTGSWQAWAFGVGLVHRELDTEHAAADFLAAGTPERPAVLILLSADGGGSYRGASAVLAAVAELPHGAIQVATLHVDRIGCDHRGPGASACVLTAPPVDGSASFQRRNVVELPAVVVGSGGRRDSVLNAHSLRNAGRIGQTLRALVTRSGPPDPGGAGMDPAWAMLSWLVAYCRMVDPVFLTCMVMAGLLFLLQLCASNPAPDGGDEAERQRAKRLAVQQACTRLLFQHCGGLARWPDGPPREAPAEVQARGLMPSKLRSGLSVVHFRPGPPIGIRTDGARRALAHVTVADAAFYRATLGLLPHVYTAWVQAATVDATLQGLVARLSGPFVTTAESEDLPTSDAAGGMTVVALVRNAEGVRIAAFRGSAPRSRPRARVLGAAECGVQAAAAGPAIGATTRRGFWARTGRQCGGAPALAVARGAHAGRAAAADGGVDAACRVLSKPTPVPTSAQSRC